MKTNTSMTHYKKNIIDHEEKWTRNVFTEVMWQEKNVVNPSTGFVEANEVNVYIPTLEKGIEVGDIIIKGNVETETPTLYSEKKFTVTSAIPCDYGTKAMQHTEIVGN